MKDAVEVVEEALSAIDKLKRSIAKGQSKQVSAAAERAVAKATSLAWLRSQAPLLPNGTPGVEDISASYRELLEFSDRSITRARYKSHLRDLRRSLLTLRSSVIEHPSALDPQHAFEEPAPDFSPLVSDPAMRLILDRRWDETALCLRAGANLAATVMMGGLLEALLLSRLNHMGDKSPAFAAASAPKNKKTGKAAELKLWKLQDFIEVAHELGWIRQSGRDVGHVLRDYRNYVHPAKEHSHGMTISADDASMFWILFQSLANQILRSA